MTTKCISNNLLIFKTTLLNQAFLFDYATGSCGCLNCSLSYTVVVVGCGHYYSWLPKRHDLSVSHSGRSTRFPYTANHPNSKKKIQNVNNLHCRLDASVLTLSLMCPFSAKKVSIRAKFWITSLSPVPLIAILTCSTWTSEKK